MVFTKEVREGLKLQLEKERALLARAQKNLESISARILGLEAALKEK